MRGVRGLPGGIGVDDRERVGVRGVLGESKQEEEVFLVILRVLDSVESAALYFLTGDAPGCVGAVVSTVTAERRGTAMAKHTATYTRYLQVYIRIYNCRKCCSRCWSRSNAQCQERPLA